jgi:hypothetical protein
MEKGNNTLQIKNGIIQAINIANNNNNTCSIGGFIKECNNGSCNFYVQLGNTIVGVVLDATNYFELVLYPNGTTLDNVDHFKPDEV